MLAGQPQGASILGRPIFVAPELVRGPSTKRAPLCGSRGALLLACSGSGTEAGPTKTTPNLNLSSGLLIKSRNFLRYFPGSILRLCDPPLPPLLVPQAQLERARPCEHQLRSLARLPVPPLGLPGQHHSGGGLGVNAAAGANKAVGRAAFPVQTPVLRSALERIPSHGRLSAACRGERPWCARFRPT